ncbi:MAG: hypothetical protein J6Z35_04295 [Lachnospiraceae bacterium]|nr:hypothetical protein [Lachnospiraceae bacterium]
MKETAHDEIREEILSQYVSSTMQAYYKEKGYEWPDSLLAAIVNQDATYEDEKIAAYRKLASVTEDAVLKQELEEACRSILGNREAFRKGGPGIVYKLEVYSEEIHGEFETGFFTDAALAEEAAKYFKSDKTLTRYALVENRDEAINEISEKGFIDTELGHMSLDPEGRIYECYDKFTAEKMFTQDELRTRFELKYQGIRHPFRTGDIIRLFRCRKSYGVAAFIKSDAELEEKIEYQNGSADLWDEVVAFDALGTCGDIAEWKMSAWAMDIVPMEDAVRRMKEEGCSKQYIDLIMSISRLKKGVGSLPSVGAAQEAYRAFRTKV